MTLVVALKARDGVVLMSDSQAVVDDRVVATRTKAEKVRALHGKVAYGCSGSAGLEQRVAAALERSISADDCDLAIEDLRPKLMACVNQIQKDGAAEYVPVGDGLPPHVQALFAGFSHGAPWVYEISLTGHDEVHPQGEAIGSGRHFVAYLMQSTLHYEILRRGIDQITVLVYRAVADAIATDATSLGLPIQGYVVTEAGAEQLTPERMKAIDATLNSWKEQEHDIFRGLPGEPDEPRLIGAEPEEAGVKAD